MSTSDLSPVLGLLSETQTLTLSTLDRDGKPRATPLFFAYDHQVSLFFLSDHDSQHCRNLEHEPSAAAAVYPSVSDWRELRGLQIKGLAFPLADPEREPALALYAARFPFIDSLADVVARSRIYRLRPMWVRLIDNRRAFGYKREWDLA
jgi:uncharacterized protein YhbP (UPF0306 family)